MGWSSALPRGGAAALLALAACSAGWYDRRGQAALDDHDLAAAEEAWRKALVRDPTDVKALAGLGWTYHLAGREDAAKGAFERCTAVAPEAVDCLRGQASVLAAGGEVARARELLRKALALAPHDPGVHGSLALLDLAAGDLDAASQRYESLVRRLPDDGRWRLGLGEVRYQQHRFDEALEQVEAGLADEDLPRRYRAMLLVLQARCLVALTADREDPARCEETAPPVRAWLDAATAALDAAEALGVKLPGLPPARRLVQRRRAMLDESCPPGP